jgi:hypothetical protein
MYLFQFLGKIPLKFVLLSSELQKLLYLHIKRYLHHLDLFECRVLLLQLKNLSELALVFGKTENQVERHR